MTVQKRLLLQRILQLRPEEAAVPVPGGCLETVWK